MSELFSLKGRVAAVTGAAGHLGAAMARGLAEAGAKVYLLGRRRESLEFLRDEIIQSGHRAEAAAVDVTNAGMVAAFAEGLPEKRLDVLVNNAFAGYTASDDAFAKAYEITVTTAFRLMQKSLPLLRAAAYANGGASVINIASMYGTVSPDPRAYVDSPPNPPFYGAAKAGLIQLTRHLAAEFAPERIRVNAISPGPFPSPASQQKFPGLMQNLQLKVPLGRLGKPEELAGAVVFLASDAASFVTGINLPVDGGWTAW
jgi:NAD(P)-dependent dehydrogenase (short-subunit alcohol dehydrogenase family)